MRLQSTAEHMPSCTTGNFDAPIQLQVFGPGIETNVPWGRSMAGIRTPITGGVRQQCYSLSHWKMMLFILYICIMKIRTWDTIHQPDRRHIPARIHSVRSVRFCSDQLRWGFHGVCSHQSGCWCSKGETWMDRLMGNILGSLVAKGNHVHPSKMA